MHSPSVQGLKEGTTYHYRIKAVNELGTTYGNDVKFKTLGEKPSVTTQGATNLTLTGATLNGTVPTVSTHKMFQLCFSSNKQKSLDMIVYQGFLCLKKYPEPGSNRHSIAATGV